MLDRLRQDVLYGLRSLRRAPGFAVAAVVVLALGIGANLGILHIVNAGLFHRLSVQNAESLVDFEPARFPLPMVEFFREQNTVFSHVLAERAGVQVLVDDADSPERAAFVSADYFVALGVNPALGRLLDPLDGAAGAPPVVVLSHRYWERRLGADPDVVGRTVRVNGATAEVVGVAPPTFTGLTSARGDEQPSLWLASAAQSSVFPGSSIANGFEQSDTAMYAALRPDVSLEAANAQLVALAAELERRYPGEIKMRPEGAGVGKPLLRLPADALVPLVSVTTLFLLVLVTACANLGNLLLARGHGRTREISVRIVLGASASRIVRQLMTENLMLAALGSLAGLGIGYATARGLLYAADAAPDLRLVTDWRIVCAACALALLATSIFGLAPARQAVRSASIQFGQHGAVRTRNVLIAAQVAASCVLLIVAAMLVRSFERSVDVDLRIDTDKIVVVDPQLQAQGLSAAVARQTLDEIAASLRRIPRVGSVTAALYPPIGGAPAPVSAFGGARVSYNHVDASYFASLGLPVVSGRVFTPADTDAVVLSEAAARRLWPGENPLGKTVRMPRFQRDGLRPGRVFALGTEERVVVGTVADLSATPGDVVQGYLPLGDDDLSKAVLLFTADDPAAASRAARAAASLPGLAPSVWTIRAALDRSRGAQRGALIAVITLGVTATLLAAVGLFGVVAFAVAQRTRELGIRIALGARPLALLATVPRQYALAIAVGGAGGCLLAFAIAQILRSRVPGLQVADPVAYLTAVGAFAAVAVVAVLIPARRATRVDPLVALRYE